MVNYISRFMTIAKILLVASQYIHFIVERGARLSFDLGTNI